MYKVLLALIYIVCYLISSLSRYNAAYAVQSYLTTFYNLYLLHPVFNFFTWSQSFKISRMQFTPPSPISFEGSQNTNWTVWQGKWEIFMNASESTPVNQTKLRFK